MTFLVSLLYFQGIEKKAELLVCDLLLAQLVGKDISKLEGGTHVTFLMSLLYFQGIKKAELLVRDLVLAQLIGKDFSELWSVVNPMGLLMAVLHAQGRGPPEPRYSCVGIPKSIQVIGKCKHSVHMSFAILSHAAEIRWRTVNHLLL